MSLGSIQSTRRDFLRELPLAAAAVQLVLASAALPEARAEISAQDTAQGFKDPYLRVVTDPRLFVRHEFVTFKDKPPLEIVRALQDLIDFQASYIDAKTNQNEAIITEVWPKLQQHSVFNLNGKAPSSENYQELVVSTVPRLCAGYGILAQPMMPPAGFNPKFQMMGNTFYTVQSVGVFKTVIDGVAVEVPSLKLDQQQFGLNQKAEIPVGTYTAFGHLWISGITDQPRVANIKEMRRVVLTQLSREQLENIKAATIPKSAAPQYSLRHIGGSPETNKAKVDPALVAMLRALDHIPSGDQALVDITQSALHQAAYNLHTGPGVVARASEIISRNPGVDGAKVFDILNRFAAYRSCIHELRVCSDVQSQGLVYDVITAGLVNIGRAEQKEYWIQESIMGELVHSQALYGLEYQPDLNVLRASALINLPKILANTESRQILAAQLERSCEREEKKAINELVAVAHKQEQKKELADNIQRWLGITTLVGGFLWIGLATRKHWALKYVLKKVFPERGAEIYEDIGSHRKNHHQHRQSALRTVLDAADSACVREDAKLYVSLLQKLIRVKVLDINQRSQAARLITKFSSERKTATTVSKDRASLAPVQDRSAVAIALVKDANSRTNDVTHRHNLLLNAARQDLSAFRAAIGQLVELNLRIENGISEIRTWLKERSLGVKVLENLFGALEEHGIKSLRKLTSGSMCCPGCSNRLKGLIVREDLPELLQKLEKVQQAQRTYDATHIQALSVGQAPASSTTNFDVQVQLAKLAQLEPIKLPGARNAGWRAVPSVTLGEMHKTLGKFTMNGHLELNAEVLRAINEQVEEVDKRRSSERRKEEAHLPPEYQLLKDLAAILHELRNPSIDVERRGYLGHRKRAVLDALEAITPEKVEAAIKAARQQLLGLENAIRERLTSRHGESENGSASNGASKIRAMQSITDSCNVHYYKTREGECPFEDWLSTLDEDDSASVLSHLQKIREGHIPGGHAITHGVRPGIDELRFNGFRIYIAVTHDHSDCLVLYGENKAARHSQTNRTQAANMDYAVSLLAEHKQRNAERRQARAAASKN